MKEIVLIEANREGYAPSQIRRTFTVGQLIEALEEYDPETEVLISNDAGYTYGGIGWGTFRVEEFEE